MKVWIVGKKWSSPDSIGIELDLVNVWFDADEALDYVKSVDGDLGDDGDYCIFEHTVQPEHA